MTIIIVIHLHAGTIYAANPVGARGGTAEARGNRPRESVGRIARAERETGKPSLHRGRVGDCVRRPELLAGRYGGSIVV